MPVLFLQAFATICFEFQFFYYHILMWPYIVNLSKIILAPNYMKLNELLQSLVELVHVSTYRLFSLLLAPILLMDVDSWLEP